MNDKKKRPSAKLWLWIILGLCLLLAVLLLLIPLLRPDEDIPLTPATDAPTVTSPALTLPITTEPLWMDLGQGLLITDIGPYTGAYVEDGTNEVVSDVLMLIVENTTSQALQYAEITLQFGADTANFSVTNLPAGERIVLLELSRMTYTSDLPDSAALNNPVFLDAFPMYEDQFQITGEKGLLTITNISNSTFTGEISVYYKNCAQDLLYGGITYRARAEGILEPGQSIQIIAPHYNPTGSTVLMVSCTS